MPLNTRCRRVKAVAALCAFGLLAVACGDDDDTEAADTTTTTTAVEEEAAGEFQEYCDAVAEMEESEEFDPAVLERIKEVAPEEISAEIDYVADAFIEAEGNFGMAFADPKVEENLAPIEAFEDEHCESDDEGEQAAIPAEAQQYCELAAELDEQDGPPEIPQLEALRAAAPAEIAEEVNMVVDAVIAAEGDIGKAFSDPAVQENIGVIEDYESGTCGIGDGEGDEEGGDEAATEPLEGAAVVEVTAVDFAFEGIPSELPAGPTSFHLSNEGEAAHEMQLFRLGEGADLDELLARDEEPSPEEAQQVGGTEARPGESAYLNVEDLAPGRYAVVCFIPGPEGKAHYDHGMKQTFTVS